MADERRVYCFHCQTLSCIGAPGTLNQACALQNNDFVKGVLVSTNFVKKGKQKLRDHANSDTHTNTMTTIEEMKSSTDIGQEMKMISNATLTKNRNYITRILSIILTLAVGGQAFRGHNESVDSHNRGNFLNMVELLRKSDPEFNEMCDLQ